MKVLQQPPQAHSLISATRHIGYSLDAAVADLVDNSIAADAKTVDIDFDEGVVYVDGRALEEDYINERTYLEEGTEFPLTVPEGSIFVMGDNRNRSSDSRDSRLGTVDARYVIGKAVFMAFPGADEVTRKKDLKRIGVIA